VSLGVGTANWQHFAVGLGAHRRFIPGNWKLDLQGEAVAALLAIGGDEPTRTVARTAFDPGVSVGFRALADLGLWVGTFGVVWLRPQEIPAPDLVQRTTLPRVELFLAAGVALSND
jgi:hypothetical protein